MKASNKTGNTNLGDSGEARVDTILDGSGIPSRFDPMKGSLICPRCKRRVDPWLAKRSDVCAPKSWTVCIRTLDNVAADIRERAAKCGHD